MKHIVIEHLRNTFHNKIFSKYITFLNFLFQALQQLRTSEFKPYVIFVKPAVQEKRKTPPMSPACEDAAAPLVSFQVDHFISQGLKGPVIAACGQTYLLQETIFPFLPVARTQMSCDDWKP